MGDGCNKFKVDFAGVLRAMQTYLFATRLQHVLTTADI